MIVRGFSIKATMEELALYMRGWRGYFGFCETPEVLIALTRWVRLRLRPLSGGSGKHHGVVERRWSHTWFRSARRTMLPVAAVAPGA